MKIYFWKNFKAVMSKIWRYRFSVRFPSLHRRRRALLSLGSDLNSSRWFDLWKAQASNLSVCRAPSIKLPSPRLLRTARRLLFHEAQSSRKIKFLTSCFSGGFFIKKILIAVASKLWMLLITAQFSRLHEQRNYDILFNHEHKSRSGLFSLLPFVFFLSCSSNLLRFD